MTSLPQFVVFGLDAQRYALPLAAVERIVQAVEVTALPGAPALVLGAIAVAGRVLPVLNLRRRFGLPEREISPNDHFVIAHTTGRTLALVVDDAQGVVECPAHDFARPEHIVPGLEQLLGVVRLEDGLVLIHDLEKLLSLDEARALADAMKREAPHD